MPNSDTGHTSPCSAWIFFATAANGRSEPILLKNNCSLVQQIRFRRGRECLSYQAGRTCCGAGRILASFRRFWAVAASRNSSFAPFGPRNRSRPSRRMRLRWAKSISTYFRSRIETAYCAVLAMSRATWRCRGRPGDVAGDLAGVFMLFAGDLAGVGIRAAFRLRGAGLAGQLQGLILGDALAGRATVWV